MPFGFIRRVGRGIGRALRGGVGSVIRGAAGLIPGVGGTISDALGAIGVGGGSGGGQAPAMVMTPTGAVIQAPRIPIPMGSGPAAPAAAAPPPPPVPPPPMLGSIGPGANTGQAVGQAIGTVMGSRFGAPGAVVGGQLGEMAGGAIGNMLDRRLQAGGSGGMPANSGDLAAILGLGDGNLLRPPIIYEATHPVTGRIIRRYGSDPGSVVVRRTVGGMELVFQMRKEVARGLGLWKPAKKPLISVRDTTALRRATSARKKLERVGRDNGLVRRPTPVRRVLANGQPYRPKR